MTNIKPLRRFIDEVEVGYLESKEDPDEWYVLIGNMCGEYSVHCAEKPEEIPGDQTELPPEARDATENVDGFFQIGAQGWSADAFEDTTDLVSDFVANRGDGRIGKLDTALMNIIVVHEDYLSEEALNLESERESKEVESNV